MTDAKRATRAGALAFAVGLGIAVATGPAVASAEVSDSDGSSPSSDTSSGTLSSTSDAESSESTSPAAADSLEAGDVESDAETTETAADDLADDDDSPKTGEASPEADELPDTEEPAAADSGDDRSGAVEPTSKTASDKTRAVHLPESTATTTSDTEPALTLDTGLADDIDDGVEVTVEQTPQEVSTTDLAELAEVEATELGTQATTTLSQTASAPVPVGRAVFTAVADIAVGVATALLSPFLSTGPNAPSGPFGSLLELIYVARSRLQSGVVNSSPIVEPVQIAQTGEQVTGTLNAFDADFDHLVYTVTEAPTQGTVVIHDDGTFTYTPDDALSAAGGVDTFEITATEADRYHLHGLRGVLTLGGLLSGALGLPDAHSASSTVAVAVSATDGTGTIIVGAHPQGVALNDDGTVAYVSNSGDNTVSVVDLATNTVIATIEEVGNYPTGIVVGAGNVYVANMFDDTVSVIDTDTNTVTATIGVGDTPQGISLNADGTRLYVANTSGNTVSVIDTATNTVAATVAVGAMPQQVAVSADGSRAYVTNFDDGTVSVIDTATDAVVASIAVGDTPQAVAVSPDGARLYVTGYDRGTVSVIDTASNAVVDAINVGLYPDAIAVSPDGTRAYVTNEQTGSVSVIDLATNAVVGAIPLGDTGSAIAVGPDGTRVYVPNFDAGTLTVTAVDLGARPPTHSLERSGLEAGDVNTFWVHNLTDQPIRFDGYQSSSGLLNGPPQGMVLAPGQSVGMTLQLGNAIADFDRQSRRCRLRPIPRRFRQRRPDIFQV
ncbi:YVTN family beta-propeller repeat protein [Mycolicibacterium sp. XJ1819]